MKMPLRLTSASPVLAFLFALTTTSCYAAATLTQQINPKEVNVGDPVMVTLTIQGGSIGNIQLPQVDGLEVEGTNFQIQSEDINGSISTSVSVNVSLIPTRPGNFTIPAFDIHTPEGDVLHVKAMKFHVLGNANVPSPNAVAPAVPSPVPSPAPSANPSFNPNGPVVMPPNNGVPAPAAPDNANSTGAAGPGISAPRDKDGALAKVFIIITPQTTEAYVGQSIPMQIDFFIRMDVAAQQDSLPTIKGSDFLMNDYTHRGHESEVSLEGQEYERETWLTAISAPKSGDFPLSMERDTYWNKSIAGPDLNSFFGGFFNRHADLAHESISSNQLTMHVHALPTEGQPAHFTGAIGQFNVAGDAQPVSVAVGEPVALRFTVSGNGNFDYVRCPALPDDPAWKTYVPSSRTDYMDESHTRAIKTFEQAVIPKNNGNVPLPAASFSYFDPDAKHYVTVPIALPAITVTGSAAPIAPASPGGETDSTMASAGPKAEFLPNRLEIGSLQTSLAPVYRRPWFWAVQGGLVLLPLLAALFLFLRSRFTTPDDSRGERARRRRSLQQEEDAMAESVRRGDAVAFFVAARHAVQLQLGPRWNLTPEALTLAEIRGRDPELAGMLEPLFTQADEVIYSGRAGASLDLADWERRVRTELLQPQPA
ncbi:MAG TPA: BatD family protein [Candidatus Methylacidiphilales bacterium]|jgi:hypothetical protein|nr:BatD family protein [Candidatus Methylacidiphilales bacterium]